MKVLVISHNSFSKIYNNGKTLSSLFSHFKKEELCQLFFTDKREVDFDRCKDYYLCTDRDVLISIFKRYKCGKVLNSRNICSTSQNPSVNRWTNGKKSSVLLMLRTLIWLIGNWYNKDLNKWLKDQSPDCIFYVGGDSIFSHIVARRIKKSLRIPMSVYFTDDYIITPNTNWYLKLLNISYKKTISQSSLCYVIGEKMSNAYEAYFHKKFIPVINTIELKEFIPYTSKQPLNINYFGGIHLGRYDAIINLCQLLNSKENDNLSINIYTFTNLSQTQYRTLENYNVNIYRGITGDALETAMRNTDLFIHVESNEEKYKSLTQYSVSTKIPEYMMYAKPIIAYGPRGLASMELIESVNDSLVIYSDEKYEFSYRINKVKDILQNSNSLEVIARDNYNYAIENFNKDILASQFRKEIASILALED